MSAILFAALAFLLGALGRRVCGGGLNFFTDAHNIHLGDLPVRLFFGVTVAAGALLAGLPALLAAALIPLTWIGTTTGLFNSLAMGYGKTSLLHDFFGMTFHGILSAAPPALAAWWMGYAWWPIALAGLVISPCYVLGYALVGPYGNPKFPAMFRGGTDLAECFWGGLVGLGTFVAVVLS